MRIRILYISIQSERPYCPAAMEFTNPDINSRIMGLDAWHFAVGGTAAVTFPVGHRLSARKSSPSGCPGASWLIPDAISGSP